MRITKKLLLLSVSLLLFLSVFMVYQARKSAYDKTNEYNTKDQAMQDNLSSVFVSPAVTTSPPTPNITPTPLPAPDQTPAPTPSPNPDRITYFEGFFEQPLDEEIIQRINGISYHENENITLDDLRYVGVLYVDFNGDTQSGELICNKAVTKDFIEIFKALYDADYQIEKIRLVDEYQADDDISCAENNTSCFNYRVVEGTTSLSKHALGLAIDINPFYNPYITYPDGKERISPKGSEKYADRSLDDPRLIKKNDICYNLFIEHGFTWGGEWKSIKDYQHFQKVLP